MAAQANVSGADLELIDVRKDFPGFTALDDMDLHIPAGQFFALLGPSGCGKTTTLRIVAGLETPTQGQVLLGGKDITASKPHERPVNTVFQSYALFPHMSVLDNIAFGLRQRKIADYQKLAKDALNLVELGHLGDRRPQQLSGGQQQRVALARALVNRPSLLLLDEPLGALDLKLRRQMQIELKAIQLDPDDGHPLFDLGILYNRLQDQASAEDDLAKATKLSPGDSTIWYAYGEILRIESKIEPALAAYRHAIELTPAHPKAALKLGTALIDAGRATEAVTVLTEAVRRDPNNAANYGVLGHAYAKDKKNALAIDAYDKFLQLAPKDDPERAKIRKALADVKKH